MRFTSRITTVLVSLIIVAAASRHLTGGAEPVRNENKNNTAEEVPLIVIDEVPLADAIRNMARQAELNFILDPRVPGSDLGPGHLVQQPHVSVSLTNISLGDAMQTMLGKYRLVLVTNPATSVARIARRQDLVKPVPATQVGSSKNAPIPTLNFDGVPLVEAIKTIGNAGGVNIFFDRKFAQSPYGRHDSFIYVRWQKITPRQALAALVDNYDLTMLEDTNLHTALISTQPGSRHDR